MLRPDLELGCITCIGWIQYVARWRHLRNTGFDDYVKSLKENSLMKHVKKFFIQVLFWSGNPEPPEWATADVDSFRKFLKSKEFRGAFCLDRMRVSFQRSGAIRLSCMSLGPGEEVGYTATPLIPQLLPLRKYLSRLYMRGERLDTADGRVNLIYSVDRNVALISRTVYFRIDKKGRTAAKAIFGSEPPFVWFRIILRIDLSSGEGRLLTRGSSIPSQIATYRRAGARISADFHDMIHIPVGAVHGFFHCRSLIAPPRQSPTGPVGGGSQSNFNHVSGS